MTTQDSIFLMRKISAKFQWSLSLHEGANCRWDVKIGEFRQITHHISETVQDGHIISIKVE